ncbi:hypothetical protein [Nocardia transvalensis]|uniref:hypothetical protein n=1 Tax=Nocardia transvalensis TaxID=37333 RepID=UPI001E2C4B3F|nr:hypothetical protein [Nocardia transvalensis]
MQAGCAVDEVLEWAVGGARHRGVPPDRALGSARVHDEHAVAFLDDRSAVGVVERLAGGGVLGVESDRDCGRGSGAE